MNLELLTNYMSNKAYDITHNFMYKVQIVFFCFFFMTSG